MTKEQLTGLGLLLIELRDWIIDKDPGSLDAAIVDEAVDVCARARNEIVAAELARRGGGA